MAKHRPNFTVASINKLEAPPKGQRTEVHDGKIFGLVLRVTPAGKKTFSFVYRGRRHGKGCHRRVTLNEWPELPQAQARALEQARARALQLQAEVASGRDPVQEKRDREAAEAAERARRPRERTLAWLADQYIALEARPSIKTWRAAERTLARHWLPALGDLPVHEVRREHLFEVLDGLVAQGKLGAAGEARKVITRLFNWALSREWVESVPSSQLKIGVLDGRQRPPAGRELRDDELAAVYLGAGQLGTPWQQAVRVILLTGARRSEITEARWSEITKDRWLEIPAVRYKANRDHTIPLAQVAWAELKSLPSFLCSDPYVFSVRGGLTPIRGLGRMKANLDEAAARILGCELPRYRLHDLRVTCRSRLALLGVPAEVAEAVIGHAKPGIVGVYNKHDYRKERREALVRYAEYVVNLVEGAQGDQRAV